MEQLSRVAAAGCLLGIADAAALGERVPGVVVTEAVARWLRELYPPDSSGVLGMMRPDRLAELHVSREIARSPALAEACLSGLDAGQARRALVLLARASADHPEARVPLEKSLSRFPDVVAGLAEPREVMTAVANAIPYPSIVLAPAHAAVATRILDTYGPDDPGRAPWLNILGVLVADLGRPEEALALFAEAVAISRTLSEERPDVFLPYLAMSLNNRASQLSGLSRGEDALAAIEEAVAGYQTLAAIRPGAFLSDLAGSLNNHASCLAGLGRGEEALPVIERAVAIRRALSEARPDVFLPDVAMSLNNYATCLAGLGRREEALAVVEEAVAIYRALAQTWPDAYIPDLATSLNNQASCLAGLGRKEEALAVIEEATANYRQIAKIRPDALPVIARLVKKDPLLAENFMFEVALSARSSTRPKMQELAASEEAVTIYRELAEARPDAFLPDLAMLLNRQANRLSRVGWWEDALDAIEEAITVYRALNQTQPGAYRSELAESLNEKASFLSELGRQNDVTLHDDWLTPPGEYSARRRAPLSEEDSTPDLLHAIYGTYRTHQRKAVPGEGSRVR